MASYKSSHSGNEIDSAVSSVLSNTFELKENKVIQISENSTDDEYPSAKCVYNIIGDISSTLDAIIGE